MIENVLFIKKEKPFLRMVKKKKKLTEKVTSGHHK